MKIGIVTDSTADLPQDLVNQYEIEVIPLQVTIDHQSYRDGVDLTPNQFFRKLKESPSMPVTSQPSLGVFVECYRRLLQKVDAILSIHLTGKFSGTVRTAQLAGEMFPEAKIKVIDSNYTTMCLGSIVLEAARAVKKGIELDKVIDLVHQLREKVNFLLVLDSLEFLRRGGRATKLQSFLGSILQIKPIFKMADGEVVMFAKARRRKEAIQMMLDEFAKNVAQESESIIAIMHCDDEPAALNLKSLIAEMYRHAEIIVKEAGPVLGTHTGPGALALVGLPKLIPAL